MLVLVDFEAGEGLAFLGFGTGAGLVFLVSCLDPPLVNFATSMGLTSAWISDPLGATIERSGKGFSMGMDQNRVLVWVLSKKEGV